MKHETKKMQVGIRTVLAIAACKMTRRLLHLMGKGGTTFPGRIALWLDRNILTRVSTGMHITLVTGTNGKTTTSRMLEKGFIHAGYRCLLNRSGANLLPGITAEFVCNADWKGKPSSAYAVIECDEGALKQVTERLYPDVIVVTNLFRDQLDRYGEVMHTRQEILTGILQAEKSVLCLNADCPLTASLSAETPNPVCWYGINVPVGDQKKRELSDVKYCISCGTELKYSRYTYAHLGDYECPVCGFRRPSADVAVTGIVDTGTDHSDVKLSLWGQEYPARISLPAVYNLYNALAAVCAGTAAHLAAEPFLKALEEARAPFGRMESFDLQGCRIQMILVKNPAGCDQAMEYIRGTDEAYGIVFCLNDRTADGHDISWIWDMDPEKILTDPKKRSVWVSGSRAEDMQLRLKYAGASEESIRMEKDYSRLIEEMIREEKRIFVLPNYTSMLEMRNALLKKTGGNEFWKG